MRIIDIKLNSAKALASAISISILTMATYGFNWFIIIANFIVVFVIVVISNIGIDNMNKIMKAYNSRKALSKYN